MSRNAAVGLSAVALTVAIAGCTAQDTQDATPPPLISSATGPPAPIPSPSGKAVLTITGAVNNHNEGSAVAFDQSVLDVMATVTANIYEPFIKKDMKFTGVPVVNVLARAGISPTATSIELHALDDFTIELKVSDLADPGILLATKADDARIPVDSGGPIRLVFPADSAVGKNRDIWIWSIDSIVVA
jgi:DMSO/TMAO reductase YedYZ molybdopterin-dependent catalytic subunit